MIYTFVPKSSWLDRVRSGQFDAIPSDFAWGQSCAFAHLINGYAFCEQLGLGQLANLANQRLDQANETGLWTGTAPELWCCLFFEHRRYRHMGEGDPTGRDLETLNRLCASLRQRLQVLSQGHKALIAAAFVEAED